MRLGTYSVSFQDQGLRKCLALSVQGADSRAFRRLGFLLRSTTGLRHLILAKCALGDDRGAELIETLAENRSTRVCTLDLGMNNLGPSSARALALLLASDGCTLERLCVDNNRLSDDGACDMAASLSGMPAQPSGAFASPKSMPPTTGSATSRDASMPLVPCLRTLSVRCCGLGKRAGHAFARAAKSNHVLLFLNCEFNTIPTAVLRSIEAALEVNRTEYEAGGREAVRRAVGETSFELISGGLPVGSWQYPQPAVASTASSRVHSPVSGRRSPAALQPVSVSRVSPAPPATPPAAVSFLPVRVSEARKSDSSPIPLRGDAIAEEAEEEESYTPGHMLPTESSVRRSLQQTTNRLIQEETREMETFRRSHRSLGGVDVSPWTHRDRHAQPSVHPFDELAAASERLKTVRTDQMETQPEVSASGCGDSRRLQRAREAAERLDRGAARDLEERAKTLRAQAHARKVMSEMIMVRSPRSSAPSTPGTALRHQRALARADERADRVKGEVTSIISMLEEQANEFLSLVSRVQEIKSLSHARGEEESSPAPVPLDRAPQPTPRSSPTRVWEVQSAPHARLSSPVEPSSLPPSQEPPTAEYSSPPNPPKPQPLRPHVPVSPPSRPVRSTVPNLRVHPSLVASTFAVRAPPPSQPVGLDSPRENFAPSGELPLRSVRQVGAISHGEPPVRASHSGAISLADLSTQATRVPASMPTEPEHSTSRAWAVGTFSHSDIPSIVIDTAAFTAPVKPSRQAKPRSVRDAPHASPAKSRLLHDEDGMDPYATRVPRRRVKHEPRHKTSPKHSVTPSSVSPSRDGVDLRSLVQEQCISAVMSVERATMAAQQAVERASLQGSRVADGHPFSSTRGRALRDFSGFSQT
jgi:hypothetical protein